MSRRVLLQQTDSTMPNRRFQNPDDMAIGDSKFQNQDYPIDPKIFPPEYNNVDYSNVPYSGLSPESTGDVLSTTDVNTSPSENVVEEEESPEEKARKTRLLIISFLLMLVFGMANKCLQVIQVTYIKNYPLFLSLITTFIYIPTSFMYIIPMIKWGTLITEEQLNISQWLFFKIGALDSVAGILQILTINYINNGTLIVLLGQSAIPISLLCSRLFLGTRYKWYHYTGCFVVFLGLAIVLLPRFLFAKSDDSDNSSSGLSFFISIVIFVLSSFPMCFSAVVKELALGEADVDPVYLNGWVAVWQFLVGIPLTIPSALATGISLPKLPQNIINGAKCWIGINSIKNDDDTMKALGLLLFNTTQIVASPALLQLQAQVLDISQNNYAAQSVLQQQQAIKQQEEALLVAPTTTQIAQNTIDYNPSYQEMHYLTLSSPFVQSLQEHLIDSIENTQSQSQSQKQQGQLTASKPEPDNCGLAPVFVNAYMAANLGYNILIIMLIKFGGANLFWICMTIMVPLTSIFFALPIAPKRSKLSIWDILGLLVLLFGLIVYRFSGLVFREKEATENTQQDGESATAPLLDDNQGSDEHLVPPTFHHAVPLFNEGDAEILDDELRGELYHSYNDDETLVQDNDGYEPAEQAVTVEHSINTPNENKSNKKNKKSKKQRN